MAHEKVYGICENMCQVEVMSKEESQEKLNEKQAKILFGTDLPEGGNDGEIFIKIK